MYTIQLENVIIELLPGVVIKADSAILTLPAPVEVRVEPSYTPTRTTPEPTVVTPEIIADTSPESGVQTATVAPFSPGTGRGKFLQRMRARMRERLMDDGDWD